ncbi:hypothetical protein LSTR_LSTR008919 [Laodelphax striatellus]|uniref:Papilin n=1 Tax=Laodelphax striatellus TaxID=195883 RepID=A0A482WM48_LAOST|nr:hypothetical protein LSTR_LSTR008919 [Laodelphax striatellus]
MSSLLAAASLPRVADASVHDSAQKQQNQAVVLLARHQPRAFLILIIFSLIEMNASNQIPLGSRESKKPVKNCRVPDSRGTLYSLQSTCSHQDYCTLEPGQEVFGNGSLVSLKCFYTYMLREEQLDFVVCYDGAWYPKDHSCLKMCRARHYKTINLTCFYKGKPVACNNNYRIGTMVTRSCKPGYRTDTENEPNHCLKNGKWQFILSECTPERRSLLAKIELGHNRNASDFEVGKQIRLSCNVDGYPAPTNITWFKDGQLLRSGGRIALNETKLGNYTISIQNATLSDSGTYQCRAENEHSSSTNTANIFVYYVYPYEPLNLFMFPMGSNVSLLCMVTILQLLPLPDTVRWFKSGQQILMRDRITITDLNCTLLTNELDLQRGVHSECKSQLIIEQASLSDSDEYKCEVEGRIMKNEKMRHEKINRTMLLSVYIPQEVSTEIKMAETKFPAGSNIEIPCVVNGIPSPIIKWFVNGNDVSIYRGANIFLHNFNYKNQVLNINGAEVFHSGTYKCTAQRGDSADESAVEISVTTTEQCSLSETRAGNCFHSIPRWTFVPEYNQCSMFYYGRCEGNLLNHFENSFESRDMCLATCMPAADRQVCQLPLANTSDSCQYFRYFPVWYHDAKLKICQQFTYGQCLGNANWFKTKEDCQGLCVNEPE